MWNSTLWYISNKFIDNMYIYPYCNGALRCDFVNNPQFEEAWKNADKAYYEISDKAEQAFLKHNVSRKSR